MIDSETLEKLQNVSIEERITIIETILQSLKNDMRSASIQKTSSGPNPLKGKVIHYDDPYQPVVAEDWEALA
jgi:hypothetical protein